MKSVPRILPLVGVAIGGVLVVNAMSGAQDLSGLLTGAQAFAEEATKAAKPDAKADAKVGGKDAKTGEAAATGESKDAVAGLPAPSIAPKAVCAPTAAELAKQAGLSPAELQVLQSLGQRRGALDARENDLNTQLALMAAAEAKLDAKIKALNGLKAEVNGLLNQSTTKEQAEIDRLVKVFEGMKAKDAAPRLAALEDGVRIKIAAKMKERALSAIMAQMSAADAKKLTEMLARRYSDAQAAATKAAAAADEKATPAKTASVDPTAEEKKPAPARKAPPRKKAPAAQQAAKPAAGPASAAASPAAAPASTPPAKSG
ncbi:MotE family protein [Phenylobacterium sp.]|uniref:MotE family protein n=1 Tax=Phenylobacterium sp. TaxID=1871053 RepID=UPI003BAAB693